MAQKATADTDEAQNQINTDDLSDTQTDIMTVLASETTEDGGVALTASELADHIGKKDAWTRSQANSLVDDGYAEKAKDGRSNVYFQAGGIDAPDTDMSEDTGTDEDTDEDTTEIEISDEGDGAHRNDVEYAVSEACYVPGGETGRMRVNRDYDFDAQIPDVDPDGYVEQQGEFTKARAEIQRALQSDSDHHVGVQWSGPTQVGKTFGAKCLAASIDAPYYRIQCTDGMDEADVQGDVSYVDEETWFNDSEVVQALISSQVRPTVLLVDEANRTPPQAKAALFPVLADECEIKIPGRNETVSGDPSNLIIMSSMNEGAEYVTYDFDFAELPRFGRKQNLTHLGMADAAKESDLIQRETGTSAQLADDMVETANIVRDEAENDDYESPVDGGVPTGVVITWASTARAYSEAGLDNPVHEAAEDTVLHPFYDADQDAHDYVSDVLARLDGREYETGEDQDTDETGADDESEDTAADATADDGTVVECLACTFRAPVGTAADDIAATLTCPECGGDLMFADDGDEDLGSLFSG